MKMNKSSSEFGLLYLHVADQQTGGHTLQNHKQRKMNKNGNMTTSAPVC